MHAPPRSGSMTVKQSSSDDSFARLRSVLADDSTAEDRAEFSMSLREELFEAEASLDRLAEQVAESTGATIRLDVLFDAASRFGTALAVQALISKIVDVSSSRRLDA